VSSRVQVRFNVNGAVRTCDVEPRWLLSDVLRDQLGLTGTHVGCEHGACGACTVLVNGEPVRACLMFGVQADGTDITTVEGLASRDGEALSPGHEVPLSPVQQAFHEAHGLQCGFCTPGLLMSLTAFLRDPTPPSDEAIRDIVSGHLCRCTGYANIVRAARRAHELLHARPDQLENGPSNTPAGEAQRPRLV
jgi:aerobic carbon-monoxide dehydrogenase small subunit